MKMKKGAQQQPATTSNNTAEDAIHPTSGGANISLYWVSNDSTVGAGALPVCITCALFPTAAVPIPSSYRPPRTGYENEAKQYQVECLRLNNLVIFTFSV